MSVNLVIGLNVDTVFQNPPFGSQKKAQKGQDLKFVRKAIELEPDVLYSFHMASTEEFLINYYHENDFGHHPYFQV